MDKIPENKKNKKEEDFYSGHKKNLNGLKDYKHKKFNDHRNVQRRDYCRIGSPS